MYVGTVESLAIFLKKVTGQQPNFEDKSIGAFLRGIRLKRSFHPFGLVGRILSQVCRFQGSIESWLAGPAVRF